MLREEMRRKGYADNSDYQGSFQTIMDTIQLHYNEILNYYNHRSTNASAEQLNSKIKAFRKSLRGVHDLCFFFFRLTKIYA